MRDKKGTFHTISGKKPVSNLNIEHLDKGL